jgi:hypothetical protein
VGTYVLRYYIANNATQVEQPNVHVSAEKTVRVNVKLAPAAQAAAQQTYVITGQAPTVDIGNARIGYTFDQDFTLSLAVNPDYGSVIAKAPGAFVDPSGNVSIGGATGLENTYIVNGMNVTGLRYGMLEAGLPGKGGGTNLPTEFLTQIDVNSGGYQAEFGGAMGGVINTVLKSGGNEFHGSVFSSYAPYWLAADPNVPLAVGSSIAGVRKPDFEDRFGFEVGGPIVKDKLFFWVGMAPQLTDSHVFRFVYPEVDDGTGHPKLDAAGNPVTTMSSADTRRLNETHRTYSYAATVNFIPRPDHKLEFAIFGTPSFNNELRATDGGLNVLNAAFPSADGSGKATWPQESLTKANTDVTAHWTSKLFDRHWQLEALGGFHDEYLYDRSPDSSLNSLNQLQYWGSDLGSLEGLSDCKGAFALCPVNPFYSRGGFGEVEKYTGNRWTAELKSTHDFEGGGHHELKYGWHLDYSTFDFFRYYSGPPGARGYVNINASGPGTVNTNNYFTPRPNEYAAGFLDGTFPGSDLVQSPDYQDSLDAKVKSISNALFLQDTWNPEFLRNLSVNAGARLEFQKMYGETGASFLSADNLAPRVGLVYDPFSDGRSKISAAYGRYYEAVPLDIAARYFGGENFVARNGVPATSCANTDPNSWTGAGEWRTCTLPALHSTAGEDATSGYNATFNGALPQSHIQGQYHNEIVATLEREVMEDTTVRIDYTHRWIGSVIEDGYGDTSFTDVLGNPGNVPQQALDDAMKDAATLSAAAAANPTDGNLAAQAANAKAKYATLQTFATAPKPQRTYDALSLTLNKRFSKAWFLRASYTYSRLVGNYEGLFQLENQYYAPNGSNAYDTPDLYTNSSGYLSNDHPHQGKVDGYYSVQAGPGKFTFGLSFVARSGMPRNYISNLEPGTTNQIVFLLPRGTAGRTPTTTQLDGHISYAQKLDKGVTLEAYVDLFNVFDQQATLQTDDNYTFDAVAPIANGTASDLKFAKNIFGQTVTKNANFGQPIAYQQPFYTRLGLRLMF